MHTKRAKFIAAELSKALTHHGVVITPQAIMNADRKWKEREGIPVQPVVKPHEQTTTQPTDTR